MFIDEIPPDWGSEFDLVTLGPTLRHLDAFVADERRADAVYPQPGDVFGALRLTPFAAVSARPGPVVFLLWGRAAQAKIKLIDQDRHIVLTAPHPASRLAQGFRGHKPFSSANAALKLRGMPAIEWSLGDP